MGEERHKKPQFPIKVVSDFLEDLSKFSLLEGDHVAKFSRANDDYCKAPIPF